jgi:hypothetical protein
MSAEEVAKAFVQHFYQAADSGADQLGSLYVSRHLGEMGIGSFFLRWLELESSCLVVAGHETNPSYSRMHLLQEMVMG